MTLTEHMSCKPDMLVKALCDFTGCEIPRVLVTRNRLLGYNEMGELMPLELL